MPFRSTNVYRMKAFLSAVFFFLLYTLRAQATDTVPPRVLAEVVIRAYEQKGKLKEIPAAINHIGRAQLSRYSPSSVVQAINALPGARMEERSPGSYRFNIRGSSLRSPF